MLAGDGCKNNVTLYLDTVTNSIYVYFTSAFVYVCMCQECVLCRQNLYILCGSTHLAVKKPMANELKQELGGGNSGREGEGDGERGREEFQGIVRHKRFAQEL